MPKSSHRITFEHIEHLISSSKVVLVDVAGLIVLAVLLYRALRIEMKW
jgi:hypothetical protein